MDFSPVRTGLAGIVAILRCSQSGHAAPVICQRKNRIVLRPASCTKKESLLGTVATTSDPAVIKANVLDACGTPLPGNACVLAAGTTPGVQVINRGAPGAYQVVFDASLFRGSTEPTCVVVSNSDPAICQAHGLPDITTFHSTFEVNCFDSTGSGVDTGFSVLCIGLAR
jgi:hypothetical protein